MTKTVEQRAKELAAGAKSLSSEWGALVSKFPPLGTSFRKDGDVGALAKQFDAIQAKFVAFSKKSDAVVGLSNDAVGRLGKLVDQQKELEKELDGISHDSDAELKPPSSDTAEDHLNSWEEWLKTSQERRQERKAVFDRLEQVDDSFCKGVAETIAKIKKEADGAKTALNAANAGLNTLEASIRTVIVKYQKTALDMNKKDIADAVRGFVVKVFA